MPQQLLDMLNRGEDIAPLWEGMIAELAMRGGFGGGGEAAEGAPQVHEGEVDDFVDDEDRMPGGIDHQDVEGEDEDEQDDDDAEGEGEPEVRLALVDSRKTESHPSFSHNIRSFKICSGGSLASVVGEVALLRLMIHKMRLTSPRMSEVVTTCIGYFCGLFYMLYYFNKIECQSSL